MYCIIITLKYIHIFEGGNLFLFLGEERVRNGQDGNERDGIVVIEKKVQTENC